MTATSQKIGGEDKWKVRGVCHFGTGGRIERILETSDTKIMQKFFGVSFKLFALNHNLRRKFRDWAHTRLVANGEQMFYFYGSAILCKIGII